VHYSVVLVKSHVEGWYCKNVLLPKPAYMVGWHRSPILFSPQPRAAYTQNHRYADSVPVFIQLLMVLIAPVHVGKARLSWPE